MDIRNRRALKQEAAAALAAAPNQKRIIAAYAGISLLMSLAVAVLDLLLQNMIEDTSGLSNIGTRGILLTAQTILPIAQFVLLLFLEYGYLGTVLRMARRQWADHRGLADGFRLFGPIVRLTLLQYLIAFGLSFVCMYLASMIFLFTPFAAPLLEATEAMMAGGTLYAGDMMADPQIISAAYDAMLPMVCIFLVIYCLLVLPITYLFRMAGYCLLDAPQAGALAALRASRNMMRRNRINLLKLDLSFWWYYLLMMVPTGISYGHVLLAMVGVELPFGDTGNSFLFFGLYLAVYFLFSFLFQNQIEVTYVNAYESLKPKPQQGGVVLGNIFQM